MSLLENHKRMLNLISNRVWANAFAIDTASDMLIHKLLEQAVLPLTLPSEKMSVQIIATNMRVTYEHIELHELLAANNIYYVILKGCASASYYTDPILCK